jgi:hypothetical protein
MIPNNIIILVMRYIFIVNLFKNISVHTIFYKFGQTQESLTHPKSRIAFFWDRENTLQLEHL